MQNMEYSLGYIICSSTILGISAIVLILYAIALTYVLVKIRMNVYWRMSAVFLTYSFALVFRLARNTVTLVLILQKVPFINTNGAIVIIRLGLAVTSRLR